MKKKILLRTKAHFSHFGTVLTSKEYSSDTDLLLSSETVQRHIIPSESSHIIPSESSHIKTISVASKMNHVCYEHFLIRPAYETAPTDQQEFSHINLISNTICSLKLTIFYLIMTRPCQPGYQKINTSFFIILMTLQQVQNKLGGMLALRLATFLFQNGEQNLKYKLSI